MSLNLDPTLTTALQAMSFALAAEYPEVAAVLVGLREGRLTEAEGMQKLLDFTSSNPDVVRRLEEIAAEKLAPTRGAVAVRGQTREAIMFDDYQEPVVMFQPSSGMPRLNPLYEAALAERIQYDGDIPEARFGALPEDVMPAVPVETMARNPVAVGRMLQQASQEVRDETDRLLSEHGANLMKLLSAPGEELVAVHEQLPAPPEPVGYESGKLPALRAVETPSGSALAALTPEQRKEAAFRFLSTTQGRRSALAAIREMIYTGLLSDKHTVEMNTGEPARGAEVVAYAEWSVMLDGEGSMQPSFAFMDVAAKVLLQKLDKRLAFVPACAMRLDVLPLNTVDVRQVGWIARLVKVNA